MTRPMWGSVEHHASVAVHRPDLRGRICRLTDGCPNLPRWVLACNGVVMSEGCEWCIRRQADENNRLASMFGVDDER